MIRVVIVDDELPAIDRFKRLLQEFSDIDIIGEAQDGIAALALVDAKKPDIIFLDIDMPGLTGLEVAKTLDVHGPAVVFVTAYDEHALEAFESSAIDYLVKPVNTSRLEKTIGKIRKTFSKQRNSDLGKFLSKIQQSPSRLAVKIGMKYEVFDPSVISVAMARDHYTSLKIEGRELLSDDSLDSILTRLDPNLFIRVHRSAAINIKFLKELRREGDRKYTAILMDKSQSQVPVSRERLPELKKFLGLEP